MSSTKIKIYKNPERNKAMEHKSYVPAYQSMGIEPAEYTSPISTSDANILISVGSTANPRDKRPATRSLPYAEIIQSPIGVGRGALPNVGNNMETTWSSVDGEIVDDISNINNIIIDNNDEISDFAYSNQSELIDDSYEPLNVEKGFLSANELREVLDEDNLAQIIEKLHQGDYLLILKGNPIYSGSISYIEDMARSLVFGEQVPGTPTISIDDLVIIKRVAIKVGLFLE